MIDKREWLTWRKYIISVKTKINKITEYKLNNRLAITEESVSKAQDFIFEVNMKKERCQRDKEMKNITEVLRDNIWRSKTDLFSVPGKITQEIGKR